jgi:hypothetical protein
LRILIERQDERIQIANSSRQEGLFDEMLEPLRLKPGQDSSCAWALLRTSSVSPSGAAGDASTSVMD